MDEGAGKTEGRGMETTDMTKHHHHKVSRPEPHPIKEKDSIMKFSNKASRKMSTFLVSMT